jgi:ketosteroid isomerase-like protein
MRTEILPSDEMPAMTAERMRRAINEAYRAYETNDRATIESLIAEDFTFTSPYDEAIDRNAYFERCWPNHHTTAKINVQRISIDGNSAYVTYLNTCTDGRTFNNTEYLTFNGGKIASVEVFFGPEYRDGRMISSQSAK